MGRAAFAPAFSPPLFCHRSHGTSGTAVLEAAHANEVILEGACEASLACSTCHVFLQQDVYDSLPEATEDEDDMLDLAPGLSPVSRLGCQVVVEEAHAGMEV